MSRDSSSNRALARRAVRAELIAELFTAAATARNEQELLSFVVVRLVEVLGDAACVLTLSDDRRWLDLAESHARDQAQADFIRELSRVRLGATEGIAGQVLATGQPVLVAASEIESGHVTWKPEYLPFLHRFGISSLLAAPLGSEGEVFGVLEIARTGANHEPFGEDDVRFLTRLTGPASVFTVMRDRAERLRQHAEGEREARRAKVIAEFVQTATDAPDRESVLVELAQAASDAVEGSLAVYRIAADGRELEAMALTSHDGVADEFRKMYAVQQWRTDEGLMGLALQTGQTVYRPYMDSGERAAYLASLPADRRPAMVERDLRAIIAIPLSHGNRLLGILTLARYGETATPFTESDRVFAETLAARANVALARLDLAAERERESKALAASATLFSTLTAESPIATVLFNRAGEIEVWNRAAEELFGWRAEEVLGQTRNPWVPDEAAAEADEIDRRGRAGEVIEGLELRRRRKDGLPVDILFYQAPYRDAAGAIDGFVVRAIDMTARKRLERELRETSETLGAILDAAPVAVITVDTEMRVSFWSHAAERMYGWTAAEVVGAPPPYAPPDDPTALESMFVRVKAGETVASEVRRATKTGDTLEIRVLNSPLYDAEGRFRGGLSVQEDVTERRRLENQLLHAQKMETVGRLAGGVAHDFNNILTAIIGYSDLAREMTHETEVAEVLQTVKAAAARAARLTQQLLAFSRRQMLQPQTVEANGIVLGMEQILRRLIGEDIELVVSVVPDAGAILVDPTQLEQVILNLAVNARDAMPEGGRLVLRTARAHFNGDRGHLDMAPGDYVVIHVSDTGVGMDEETRRHIFEPFFTTKEVGKGTGLGLATTYGIVRQSGGYIWVDSALGRGTTFEIYFPRVGGGSEPQEDARAILGPRSGRVLLVEDEPTLRDLARLILARNGFAVLEAHDPATALRLAADAGPLDLLVTDVIMPGTTGIELARRLRETQPDLKVLFMSGYSEDVTGHDAPVGRGFLAKPFTPESLLRAVDEALGSEIA